MGSNTPEVETAWRRYKDRSCCGDKHGHGALLAQAAGGEIKERTGVRSMRKACGWSCAQKEERKEREGEGVRYGDEA